MPGWNVPGYTTVRALGSGGFGEVILGRHDSSGALVAIKYLRQELLTDPGFAGMFRGEAQVLASLEDPDIVRLYEYVESPSGAAIVMELINGVSLREILAHQGKTAPEAALAVLQGSLMGLAAAHRRGVVHRDYKPENVLVNGHGLSKLTDFGLAARTGERPVPAGTLMYVAPEQIDGAPASPAGDIYSATATFYECLTGRPPFSGESAELLRQHHFGQVPLDPVPEPLRPLVAAGMAKDPARRPADATSLATQLQTAAFSAYGSDWERRGRSHLGEAALLLAGLWPASAPPLTPGTTTVQRISGLPHIAPAKAAIAAGTVIAIAAAGTALAVSRGHRNHHPSQPAAATQPVSLQPATTTTTTPKVTPTTPKATSITPAPCTAAALSKGLVAANPQLNGYSWKLASSACESGWAIAQVYAPAVGYGVAFLKLTRSGWTSGALGEGSCSMMPGAFGLPLPPQALAVSLLAKAGICGNASASRGNAVRGYSRYTNARYGFTILWPSSFRAQPPPEDGDGHGWTSLDGQVLLSAYGTNNVLNYSPKQDEAFDTRRMSVVYENISGNVVTISGFKHGGRTIVYQRDVVGAGSIDTLHWSYPASKKARWDATVTLTAQTFQPGNVTVAH